MMNIQQEEMTATVAAVVRAEESKGSDILAVREARALIAKVWKSLVTAKNIRGPEMDQLRALRQRLSALPAALLTDQELADLRWWAKVMSEAEWGDTSGNLRAEALTDDDLNSMFGQVYNNLHR